MNIDNMYFITGTAYAGKSTMIKLLAERFDGIACEENYHDQLLPELDSKEFPAVTYTRDIKDWHDFVKRSPQEYSDWFDQAKAECEILEMRILEELSKQNKKIFVDTNISLETLRTRFNPDHVVIMLAEQDISVKRFFERPDPEKQFLYQLLLELPDPEKAIANFREGLTMINSKENYEKMQNSGFKVIYRDETRSKEETLDLVARYMGLIK